MEKFIHIVTFKILRDTTIIKREIDGKNYLENTSTIFKNLLSSFLVLCMVSD